MRAMSGRTRTGMAVALAGLLALVFAPFALAADGGVGSSRAGAAAAGATVRSHTGPIAALNASQSNNWSGYNQGTIEKGGTTFHSVAGDWIVPAASQHSKGESEYSASWLGIGGGCEDSSCNTTDNTLIQAGTEQDVVYDALAGTTTAQYSAWWELIPNASTTIDNFPVKAGDHIHVDIHENGTGTENWTIIVQNVTTGQTFTTTVSYDSTYATAEWIEEAPTVVSIYPVPPTVRFAPVPNLTPPVHFDLATANGKAPSLVPGEAIQLVDFTGNVEATPSNPDAEADGFADCTYATSCATPTTTIGTTTTATGWHAKRRRHH